MIDSLSISREAWNAIRKSHQPVFDDLTQTYRDTLQALAEAVIATGATSCGAGNFALFEKRVLAVRPLIQEEQEVLREPLEQSAVAEPPLQETVEEAEEAKAEARAELKLTPKPAPKKKVVKIPVKPPVKKAVKVVKKAAKRGSKK